MQMSDEPRMTKHQQQVSTGRRLPEHMRRARRGRIINWLLILAGGSFALYRVIAPYLQ